MYKRSRTKDKLEELIKARAKKYLDGQSVTILPVASNNIVLNKQYRRVSNTWNYELPGGKVEGGEKPETTAARELEEEAGFHAGRLQLLFKAYPVSGMNSKRSYFYLATELKKVRSKREQNEKIVTKIIPIDVALEMVREGKMADSKSIGCILYYYNFIRKQQDKTIR